MRNLLLLTSVWLVAAGCGTESPGVSANAITWTDVDEVSIESFTNGVRPGSGACTTSSIRYDFHEHVLVDAQCATDTRTQASAEDSAALLAALRGIAIVDLPCSGYDGVDTSVIIRHGSADARDSFPLGSQTCTNGGSSTMGVATVTAESWAPVNAILFRIRAAR